MKKITIILILFVIVFGQLCYADNGWISYKNNNKISLDNKIISQADITFVGLFIYQENKIKTFQSLNIPLTLSSTLSDLKINCIDNLSVENERININPLIISGKIRLSQTKSASKHWIFIEIPELLSNINYSKESNNIKNSFSGKAASDAYEKSIFLFTTGIAPKELMPYADRLMQRTFDFTYKENNNEENFSLTLFAALNSVKYSDETIWSLGDISYVSKTTQKNVTINDTPEVVAENKNSEEKSNSMSLYLIAGVIIIAVCIWIAVRIKNSSNNKNTASIQENKENKTGKIIINQTIVADEPIKEENPTTNAITKIKPLAEEKPVEEIKPIETTVINETTEKLPSSDLTDDNTASKVNFCPNCGEKIFEGATFCATCGTKIE